MGGCVIKKKAGQDTADECDDNIDKSYDHHGKQTECLWFDGKLGNIKIKNSPKKVIWLKFCVPNILNLELPRKIQSQKWNQIQWKSTQELAFSLSETDLRRKCMKVQAYDQNNHSVAKIKIPLFDIVNGPYHHDLGFSLEGHQTRILFDLKISQTVEITVQPLNVQIQLANQYPGEQFNYSFSVLKNDVSSRFSSQPSDTLVSPLLYKDSFRFLDEKDQCISPRNKKTPSKFIKIENPTKLKWNYITNMSMSRFTTNLKSLQMMKCSIRYVLWRITSGEVDEECILFANNYFSFSSIFATDFKIDKQRKSEERIVQIREDLWNHGKNVGECKMKLKVNSSKFYKQMQGYTRTQDGIIDMSPLFSSYGTNKTTKSQIIKLICDLHDKIINKNGDLSKINSFLFASKARKIKQQIFKLLQQLYEVLKLKHQQSFSYVINQQKQQILEDQQKLISVSQKLYKFIEDDDPMFTELCWGIQTLIMSRGQFLLRNIGIFQDTPINDLERKKIIALKYQQLLFKILKLALSFSQSDYRKEVKQYTYRFKAICYNKVYCYREKLLQILEKKDDLDVLEWNRLFETANNKNQILKNIDWNTYFYNHLKNDQIGKKQIKDLKQYLSKEECFKHISQRKDQFFILIRFIIHQLQQMKNKLNCQSWSYFPGYSKLIRSFLSEMYNINISQYPRQLQITSINLLSNEKLINPIMKILFQKTNIYDNLLVIKTFQLLNNYFSIITKDRITFPITFDYLTFFKGIKLVLEGDFSYSILKVLALIYNYYQKFNIQFKENISKYLLGKIFFNMFLNWSGNVREVFHHLIIVKIEPQINSFNENMMKMNKVATMYKNVMLVAYSQLEKLHIGIKNKIFSNYQKDLFKVMKRKLNCKKHSKQSELKQSQEQIQHVRQRKYSEFIQPNIFDKIINKSNFFQEQMTEINIFGNKSTDYHTQLNPQKSNQKFVQHKFSFQLNQGSCFQVQTKKMIKQRIECFFGKNDFQLQNPSRDSLKYLETSLNRYEQIKNDVLQITKKTGKTPHIKLNTDVKFDQKDIRPISLDQLS